MWRAILTARARPSSGVAVINVPPGTRTSSESGTRVIESPESVKFESQAYHAQAKFNASRQRRVAQVFDVAATTAIGVPRSFAFFSKEAPERLPIGGSCKTDNEAKPAASPPTSSASSGQALARNARMGTLPPKLCKPLSKKDGVAVDFQFPRTTI